MALSIQLSTDFSTDAVNFSKLRKNKMGGKAVYLSGSGNSKLYIQLPFLRAPYGLGSYTDDATKKTSYSIDLSLDPNDPVSAELEDTLKVFDELVLSTVEANSPEWLGKKYTKSVLQEALYKPLVRPGKGEWPATFKLKVQTNQTNGSFVPESYNMQREPVPLDSLEKGQRIMAIVDISQIWFIDNKFGVSVRLLQCLFEPSKKLPSFAFKGIGAGADDEDDVEYEEVEEEVDV